MCLIRRWLRAPLEQDGILIKRRMGVPQGSPISPLLSNIILHELDSEMEKLKLPINKEKNGIRRPVNFQILGLGFVPIYRKGSKDKYQLIVTKKRWQSFRAKLKEETRKINPKLN
ncbi:RNA-dependent RNA polymerase family protein [Saccharicrinis fermentans]|uniref:Retron-type reverse transcriptase n=1 Tax=Saccharicrinis fermentans DSM 9555 = JCM 21142 TaxID=869213 RepID=W7YEH3_9BACT|nr:hypothetical protein [Saccharicrinis fermentans]GAF05878.1 retron-type reverse transcriptase [Saccharicrinis fermentans DSM 9555 = JCM 21142]